MDCKIRKMNKDEFSQLNDFLYEAIFISKNTTPPPKSIIKNDDLQIYVKDFGDYADDFCLVALVNEKIIGCVWSRIMNDYGHIDNKTPSLAISLYKEYRNFGIGTMLMKEMLKLLKDNGYNQVSLSVQKANYAFKLYKKLGFNIIKEDTEEFIMVCDL